MLIDPFLKVYYLPDCMGKPRSKIVRTSKQVILRSLDFYQYIFVVVRSKDKICHELNAESLFRNDFAGKRINFGQDSPSESVDILPPVRFARSMFQMR